MPAPLPQATSKRRCSAGSSRQDAERFATTTPACLRAFSRPTAAHSHNDDGAERPNRAFQTGMRPGLCQTALLKSVSPLSLPGSSPAAPANMPEAKVW